MKWQVYPASELKGCDSLLALSELTPSVQLRCQGKPGHAGYCYHERLENAHGGFRVEWWPMEGMQTPPPPGCGGAAEA